MSDSQIAFIVLQGLVTMTHIYEKISFGEFK